MLKPNEVNHTLPFDSAVVRDTERLFDDAIRDTESSGQWPAVIRPSREGLPLRVLQHVCELYRAAGWYVTGGRTLGESITIEHPENRRSALCRAVQDPAPVESDNGLDWYNQTGHVSGTGDRH